MENEYSIKLRLETLPKYQVLLILLVFVVGIVGCVIGSFFLPELLGYDEVQIHTCLVTDKYEKCFGYLNGHEGWRGKVGSVTVFNQFLFLHARPKNKADIDEDIDIDVLLVGKSRTNSTSGDIISHHVVNYNFKCRDGECSDFLIFYEPYIEYGFYDVTLEFLDRIPVSSIEFKLGFGNKEFTRIQLWIKGGFLAASLISLGIYLMSIRKLRWYIWSFESKMILALSISVILFNEPWLILAVYEPSATMSLASTFCVTQFIFVLILFWILIFQNHTNLPFKSVLFYVELVSLMSVYLVLFGVYAYIHINLKVDPSYNWKKEFTTNFKAIYIIIAVLLVILGLILIVLIILAIPLMFKNTSRRRFIAGLNIGMILLTFTGIAVGAFQPFPRSGALMLIFLAGMNIYVYLIAILYVPNKKALYEYHELFRLSEAVHTPPASDEIKGPSEKEEANR